MNCLANRILQGCLRRSRLIYTPCCIHLGLLEHLLIEITCRLVRKHMQTNVEAHLRHPNDRQLPADSPYRFASYLSEPPGKRNLQFYSPHPSQCYNKQKRPFMLRYPKTADLQAKLMTAIILSC